MMRPETVQIDRPLRDRSFDSRLNEVRRMLAQARPEQIFRLMDDIRKNDGSDEPRGTA
ncbi:MAG: hypothetical protein R6U99_13725 [Nioella sp.]